MIVLKNMKYIQRLKNKTQRSDGFSLLELSILLLILGIFTVPLINSFRVSKALRNDQKTQLAVENSSSALAEYFTINGFYPCPADPRLPVDNANHGQAECNPFIMWPNGLVDAADFDDDDIPEELDGVPGVDSVMIGFVPYETLGISIQDAIDGYGSKLLYAVSVSMTDNHPISPASVLPEFGVIQANVAVKDRSTGNIVINPEARLITDSSGAVVNDSNGDDIPDEGLLPAIVLSHGSDRKGAYSINGGVARPCPVAAGTDSENCNGDALFFKNLRYDAPGATYFDDIVSTRVWNYQSLWSVVGNDNLKNNNPGNVGINTRVPTAALHVVGNIRANQLRTDLICREVSSAETVCFEPQQIGGQAANSEGMRCPGLAMEGISRALPDCDRPSIAPPTLIDVECGLDAGGNQTFLHGFDAAGDVICVVP